MLLVYVLTSRYFDRRAAAVAWMIACFYPAAIHYANVVGTERLFSLLVVLGVLALDRYAERPSRTGAAIVGGVWSAGLLTNAVAMAFLPWVAAFQCLHGRRSRFRHRESPR